jgi:hypothetical protein
VSKFFNEFRSAQDVIKEYEAPADALDGAEIILAWYGYGSYEGDSLVVFKKDGKLWEVNGSHCSCFGLEGQWKPEETSIAALKKRYWCSSYDGEEDVKKFIDSLEDQP